ncbi:hypothetical protein MUU74_02365 [Chryseobacterium daecheongense]|uniref:hypothetical protein n=1 Tax=Chryseobacterium daecheongense TaxID=192389 RepID=UPI001FD67690|nr:hypothetical protein [Chryseobacterium daecheongense]UOU98803.1 hypothetical protein MUU74_02365 [Chryseobacterium daecheongense]
MKHITSFFLILLGVFSYSQTNEIKIDNFSAYDIPFTIYSNSTASAQDCVPIIYNESPVVLPAGASVAYGQHNSSNDPGTYLPISVWHYVGGNFDKLYNLANSQYISSADASIVTWSKIKILAPNGQEYALAIGCLSSGIYTFTAGGITAEISSVGNTTWIQIF